MITKKGIVHGFKGLDVPYQLISQEGKSKQLAIILPGLGYTVQAPLLHYSTGIFLHKGFDVLQVNYQYLKEVYQEFSDEEMDEAVRIDAETVISEALAGSSYENFYIIGKSLGTISVSSELKRDFFKNAKVIWLTPLIQREDVKQAMLTSKQNGLCIIGDEDPFYDEKIFNELNQNRNLTLKLIQGADHSLEYPRSPVDSIDVLKRIIEEMVQF
jgi:alpha/beta superfamily hydrolase